MLPSFWQPTIVSALIAALVTLCMPYLTSALKRSQDGKLGEASVRIREIDHTEKLIEAQSERITKLQERQDQLEQELTLAYQEARRHDEETRSLLSDIEADLSSLREEIEQRLTESPHGAELAKLAVECLHRVRQGRIASLG